MNINELIGYKEHPIYKQARTTYDPKTMPKVGSYGGQLKRAQKIKQFKMFLQTHGFKELGHGSFAAVFEKPGYPWVFKIFTQDPAYLAFLKYALAHQSNPSVPKIKGKILNIVGDTFAVRLEKLDSIYKKRSKEDQDNLYHLFSIITKFNDYDKTEEDIEWIKEHYPDLAQVLLDLDKGPWDFDLSMDNILYRGNVPVVSDPIYDPKGMN